MHSQKSRFYTLVENVIFAVLEYFNYCHKTYKFSKFFSIDYNITRDVFVGVGGWKGGWGAHAQENIKV